MRVLQIINGRIVKYVGSLGLIRSRIISELTGLAEGYKGTGWKVSCPVKAFERTQNEFTYVLLEDGGIMAVSSQVPWFAEEFVLCEEWLGAGVTVHEAAEALRLMCKTMGFTRFEVGTRAAPGQKHEAAARLYQRQGLRLSTISLEGVVNDEQETVTQGHGSSQAT